jgi:hypothetical protein
VTMPPVKLPTPAAAELRPFVSQDCCCWGAMLYRRIV